MNRENQRNSREKRHVVPPIGKSKPPDKKLYKRTGGGFADLRCLPEEFYRRVMAPLARIAERTGLPRDQCEDMAQEAWIQALEHSEQFPGEHTLTEIFSWLAVIVHNAAANTRRTLNRHPVQALEDSATKTIGRKEAERASVEAWNTRVAPLLARLRREDLESWRLVYPRYLEERKVRDLAVEEGRSAHEISYRIHRAVGKLRSWANNSGLRAEEAS